MLAFAQEEPAAFDQVVDLIGAGGALAVDRAVKVLEGQVRLVAFEVEAGPQAIEVRQSRLDLDGALERLERFAELALPAVRLSQIDKSLVGLGLELDRRVEIVDRVVDTAGADAQAPPRLTLRTYRALSSRVMAAALSKSASASLHARSSPWANPRKR